MHRSSVLAAAKRTGRKLRAGAQECMQARVVCADGTGRCALRPRSHCEGLAVLINLVMQAQQKSEGKVHVTVILATLCDAEVASAPPRLPHAHTSTHNTTQHNTTQHNTTQHNTTQHNTTQHNTTQHEADLEYTVALLCDACVRTVCSSEQHNLRLEQPRHRCRRHMHRNATLCGALLRCKRVQCPQHSQQPVLTPTAKARAQPLGHLLL